MAGDWFPLQYWRSRCPEIVRVSSTTGRTRHEVLGLMCDFWSWVSTESADGRVPGVWVKDLPEVVGSDPQFWAAVKAADWLSEDEEGIVVPDWGAWLSESAKKRAKDARRKAVARLAGGSEGATIDPPARPHSVRDLSAKSPPTGQDITEQEEKKKPPNPPPGGETGAKPKKAKDPPKGEDPGAAFARFWEAYPRKTAKPAAIRAWQKLKPDEALVEVLLEAIQRQSLSDQWRRDGGQYIPHPATWLNGRRWEDQPPEVVAPIQRRPAFETHDERVMGLIIDANLRGGQ